MNSPGHIPSALHTERALAGYGARLLVPLEVNMITRLEIVGLGPHKRSLITLDPAGITTISGPSEIGKSTILESILITLLGRGASGRFRTELIHDTVDKAEVKVSLQDGRILRRTISRSKSVTRNIITNGQKQSFSSEARYAEALGSLAADPEATRVIVAPLGWQSLITANARPFRDLLTRAMPSADPAQEVANIMEEHGLAVSTAELAWTEKDATAARRAFRRDRDQLTGSVSTLEDQILQTTNQLSTQTVPDTTDAEAVLAVEAEWVVHDQASQQAGLAAERARQLAALGEAPPITDPVELARAAESQADTALQQITTAWRESRRHRDHLAEQLGGVDTENPDVCPTCQRPGWDEGAAQIITLQARLAAAEAALKQATTDGEQARTAQRTARERVRAAQEAQARRDAWQRTVDALSGPLPESPAATTPTTPRPLPTALQEARALVRSAEQARIGAQQRQNDLARLQQQKVAKDAQVEAAKLELIRLEALLDAIRQAPSRLAERQAAALGDLGPVTLQFGENPAVTMLIDGRPWWLASRGRQVVADICLRAALRRAFGLHRLPIVVDNVQDVGGQPLPDVGGPIILLRTTDEVGLSIKSGV